MDYDTLTQFQKDVLYFKLRDTGSAEIARFLDVSVDDVHAAIRALRTAGVSLPSDIARQASRRQARAAPIVGTDIAERRAEARAAEAMWAEGYARERGPKDA